MNIKQWEIWDVDFNPTKGAEIGKTRPAIVVNANQVGKLPLKVVIPITDVRAPKTWHQTITPSSKNGLTKESQADCFQLKSVSANRFVNKRGGLEKIYHSHIQLKMMLVLGIKLK